MTILPATYLGSTTYFAHLLREECVVDIHEHFLKRSERNRAHILTASGVMDLTVQVQRANHPQTPMCEMQIDYSKRWQHQHHIALLSAYKSSPYFDFYWDELAPFYEKKYDFLVDYNIALTRVLLRLLGHAERMPHLSLQYLTAEDGDQDLRPKQTEGSLLCAEPYMQVFSDRMPFEPNLSVVDLLFAEGPSASAVLARSRF
ncbi:MAG: WbqC family protein [Alistipes sp.]